MFSIRIADHVFHIDNRYKYLEELCSDYVTDDKCEACIQVSDEEMTREKLPDENYPPCYHESTAVYRKICEYLIPFDIFLFHCSALTIDGKAILFGAPSGTGKSTHAGLWKQTFGDRVQILNDDKPLIYVDNKGIAVFGTPWAGKHSLQKNLSAPVEALFFIERAEKSSVEPLTMHEAYPMALNQTYRPDDVVLLKETLKLLNRFLESVPIYRLKCDISEDAVLTAYSVLGDK